MTTEQKPRVNADMETARLMAERDTLAARLAAVEALADGPTGDGYQPYAVTIGTEVHLAVLLDDIRAALATCHQENE